MPDSIRGIFHAIESLSLPTAIRDSLTGFPWLETAHIVAATLVVGLIVFLDLRLIGVHAREQPVTKLKQATLPWVWGSFALAAVSGLLLFSQTAVKYAALGVFQAKMLLLVLAGINMLVFQLVAWKDVDTWDTQIPPPPKARAAGCLSLALWLCIVVLGRWIGFSLL
jgi:hypothetical protein